LTGINCSIFLTTFAQSPTIDSLNTILKNVMADTVKVNTLYNLALEYKKTEPDKLKDYLNKSYSLAVKINYKKGIGNNLFSFGEIELNIGNYEKALSFFNRSLEIREQLKDKANASDCLNSIGNIYRRQGNFEKAIDYHTKSLALRTEIKDLRRIGNSYNNLGNVYLESGDFSKGLKHYLQALDTYEKGAKDRVPAALSNIGSIYLSLKDYPKALDYYQQVLEKDADKITISNIYNNMGIIYMDQKIHDKAQENFLKALKLNEEIGNKDGVASALSNLAGDYTNEGKFAKAQEYNFRSLKMAEERGNKNKICNVSNNIAETYQRQKDFKKALEYAEKALSLGKEIGVKVEVRSSYEILSQIYKDLKDYEKSLEYYKLFTSMKDSIFSKEKTQAIAELQTRYDSDKKEKEIQLLTKDNQLKEKAFKEQRIIRLSLIAGLGLLFILSFTLYNRYRFKQKANLLLEKQKKEIEQKNILITDSIDYAKTIQEAILPSRKAFDAFFPDSFILYKPKAIVSGDFYWVGQKGDKIICAVADCTGHGVPGAFMSLLGNNILENVIKKNNFSQPASILDSLNEDIITALTKGKEKSSVKNGMDIALISIDKVSGQLQYAGAHNPLYLIRNGELSELKADKISIGFLREQAVKFTNHTMELKKDDMIYLFSDGFPDQIGGQNRKKFYYQPFKDLLLSIHQMEMDAQKKHLDKVIEIWQGEYDQTDDILIMGVKC
jgi:serine phosphatase RsbU (regulator of sigma subunit)/Tfp pilus assembly protein PilF